MGFWVYGNSVSGQDPKAQFGITISDLGDFDIDFFGEVTMDTGSGKHFMSGDMFLHDPLKYLKTPLPLENGGEPVVVTSDHFLEWQGAGAVLRVNRPADHVFGIIPIMCIEVKR